jgi:hypothetical protein
MHSKHLATVHILELNPSGAEVAAVVLLDKDMIDMCNNGNLMIRAVPVGEVVRCCGVRTLTTLGVVRVWKERNNFGLPSM